MAITWDEFFPGFDANDSKVKGLFEALPGAEGGAGTPCRRRLRLRRDPHRRPSGRLDHLAVELLEEQGSRLALHAVGLLEGRDARVCTLGGGVSPMRISSFADPRVKEKAVVGPGTTRHLDAIKWTIDNAMGSEPDMPIWADFSNNDIPVELGKLLTGQDYDGDPKKCMDAIAAIVDGKVTDAGLR